MNINVDLKRNFVNAYNKMQNDYGEDTDNVQRIVDIIQKKYYNKMIDENSRRKVFAALMRLGYGYSDIRQAMSEFSDDEYYEE